MWVLQPSANKILRRILFFLSFLRFGYLTHKALRLSSCFFNLLSLVMFSTGKGHKITP